MALHEAVKFFNPTDKDFVGYWDGEPYDVPAKSHTNVAIYIAKHFAKHLASKILRERYDAICDEHEVTTTPLTKTCPKCKEKSQKIENMHNCDDRKELYKIMLESDSVVKEPVETTEDSSLEVSEETPTEEKPSEE